MEDNVPLSEAMLCSTRQPEAIIGIHDSSVPYTESFSHTWPYNEGRRQVISRWLDGAQLAYYSFPLDTCSHATNISLEYLVLVGLLSLPY